MSNDSYYRGTVETILVPIQITYHDATDIVYSCDVANPLVDGMPRLEEAVKTGLRVENLHRAHQHLAECNRLIQSSKEAMMRQRQEPNYFLLQAQDYLLSAIKELKGGR